MKKLVILVLILLIGCVRPPMPTGGVVLEGIESDFEEEIEVESGIPEIIVTASPDVQPTKPVEPGVLQINLTRNGFEPRNITIAKGSTIYFINYDRAVKQIVSSDFTSPLLRSLQGFEQTFKEVGVFGFHEKEQPGEWGRVIVIEPVTAEYERLVKITPYHYIPDKVEITVGDRVRWRNTDTTSHTVSGAGFDSQTLRSQEEFTHTFERAGEFPYGDSYHGNLVGTVIVKSKQ